MRFGVTWVPDDLAQYPRLVRETEAAGVDFIGVPDTQASQYRECYVTLTTLFANTERAVGGPLTTNPLTRHPAVTAAAVASADELSGGRAVVCVSTGDTGVLNLGLRPARLATVEEYALTLREIFSTGTATYRGKTSRVAWAAGRRIPIYLAADGPGALRLAGKVADGVVAGLGLLPDTAALVRRYVAEGAAEAGRDPGEIDMWYMARAAIADAREDALRLVRASLAAAAAHAFRFSFEGKAVPPDLAASIEALRRGYDVKVHNAGDPENPNARLVDELGLTDYLAERMAIVGTPRDWVDKLLQLKQRGVEKVVLRPLVHDRFQFLDRLADITTKLR